MLQCVAVFCVMFQCGAVCCSVLQCVAVCCNVLLYFIYDIRFYSESSPQHHVRVEIYVCIERECVAVCCRDLQ
jgi:hypothetical protein